ncbi:hypothetical protein GTZ99_12525 [Novosphingobium sp. FSY-8]|uniref:Uncharacterized protein n=1 Tax=Novosphingobium ovatum TaxID=1908523 RepID=A0ABW9XFT3_9SPHN|nr:hypothetical protein [Novosphingobium ovatum]NBC37376.1 hypothetical protein [Novosphingobium ovatum]
MRLTLIENWARHLWAAWSVRIAYLVALPGIVWPVIPDDVRAALPPEYVQIFAIVAAVSIAVARVVQQPKLTGVGQTGAGE